MTADPGRSTDGVEGPDSADSAAASQGDGVPVRRVLLVATGPSVPGDGLVAGVRALQQNGSRVELVSRHPACDALATTLDAVHALPGGPPRTGALLRRLAAWLSDGSGPGRTLRLDPDRLPGALRLHRDPVTRALIEAADVVVAVDQAAVPAAWLAARRRPTLVALSGLPAAVTRFAPRPDLSGHRGEAASGSSSAIVVASPSQTEAPRSWRSA